jgi:hypothetical protein
VTRLATFQACDEIASAGLGKFAFIGVYSADLLVPSIPFSMPQLFFVVRFRTPIDDRPKKFKVRIERPGHPNFEIDNTASLSTPITPAPDAKFFQAQAIVRIAPFEITQVGTIRVYVEDELGDNYAGGLRVTEGVHPELRIPQIAGTAGLVAGHFQRLNQLSTDIRQKEACQLLEAMSAFMTHSGLPPTLQFPDSDVRLLLDGKRAHVFFPKPLDYVPAIEIETDGNFDAAEIEMTDEVGFIARFTPSAPPDLVFNYAVSKPPKKTSRKKTAAS